MPGQDSAREVVEAGAARRAAVALPVRLGVVPAVAGDLGTIAARAANAVRPAVLPDQLEALRVVDQRRQVHQGRRGHGRHRGYGNALPQPPSASVLTRRPTTPDPDKSVLDYRAAWILDTRSARLWPFFEFPSRFNGLAEAGSKR